MTDVRGQMTEGFEGGSWNAEFGMGDAEMKLTRAGRMKAESEVCGYASLKLTKFALFLVGAASSRDKSCTIAISHHRSWKPLPLPKSHKILI